MSHRFHAKIASLVVIFDKNELYLVRTLPRQNVYLSARSQVGSTYVTKPSTKHN